MLNFQIRNSFVHTVLFYYTRLGFNAASSVFLTHNSYRDDFSVKNHFDSIYRKVKDKMSWGPSFANEFSKVLQLPSPYPIHITLTRDEAFLFELIMNMNYDTFLAHVEHSKKDVGLRRLYSVESCDFTNLETVFNTKEAVDFVRNRFLKFEKIGNEPARVGFYINNSTGIAHKIS